MTQRRLAVLVGVGLVAAALALATAAPALALPALPASTPSPSPTGSSPTGSSPTGGGPDFRFILLGIGCILFAIVIARRGKRKGKSERNWF